MHEEFVWSYLEFLHRGLGCKEREIKLGEADKEDETMSSKEMIS